MGKHHYLSSANKTFQGSIKRKDFKNEEQSYKLQKIYFSWVSNELSFTICEEPLLVLVECVDAAFPLTVHGQWIVIHPFIPLIITL